MNVKLLIFLGVLKAVTAGDLSLVYYNSDLDGFAKTVSFYVYLPDNSTYVFPGDVNASTISATGCSKDTWMMFSHGWGGNCSNDWTPTYINKMKQYRGGCIICFDYNNYSTIYPYSSNYFLTAQYFGNMVHPVYELLTDLNNNGYGWSNSYIYGFSFGAQIMINAAYNATNGSQAIPRVDACEKDGVSYYPYFYVPTLPDPKLSGKFVTFIKTSSDKSTQTLDCHQNWLLGTCGDSQAAAGPAPYGNHGLCPVFWNYAFDYDFPAIPNPYPYNCITNSTAVSPIPNGTRLGYPYRTNLTGVLYANTFASAPYNA